MEGRGGPAPEGRAVTNAEQYETPRIGLVTAQRLGEVIRAAVETLPVARATVDGDVIVGTARRIAGDTDDVLNARLQVTTRSGWEVNWTIKELVVDIADGTFVVGYEE